MQRWPWPDIGPGRVRLPSASRHLPDGAYNSAVAFWTTSECTRRLVGPVDMSLIARRWYVFRFNESDVLRKINAFVTTFPSTE
jgi:hypothetical protein